MNKIHGAKTRPDGISQLDFEIIEHRSLRLLVAKLVDSVDALEGEAISFTVGRNLALANDAVRVALGNPSRLQS